MFSFPTATEHGGKEGGRGAALSAFTLLEAATRGILWKKLILKIFKISKNTFFTEHHRTTASFYY